MAPPSPLSVQNLVPWLIFHESSLISFAGSDSTSNWQGGWDKMKEKVVKGVGVSDYFREVIIYISIYGGIIWGRRLFEEGD